MQELYKKYEQFTVSDFVLDEDFVLWVKTQTTESMAFWESFVQACPEKEQTIAQAKILVGALQSRPEAVPAATKDRVWAAIQANAAPARVVSLKRWWVAVASFILLAGIAAVLVLSQQDRQMIIQTQYGEFKEVILPDQSVVTLNGNSRLRFKKQWNNGAVREVWINGDAFFNVRHLNQSGQPVKPQERFVVHANGMDIEVLGTSFSVTVRQEKAKVILQSGKIQLRFDEKQTPSIVMQPGDKVVYSKNEKPQKAKALAGEMVLWKRGNLSFDSTSLKEVFDIMNSDFGYHIIVLDSAVLNRTMTGSVPTGNKAILLKALSIAMELNIQQQGDTLIIGQ
jgi:transmembrane sensor